MSERVSERESEKKKDFGRVTRYYSAITIIHRRTLTEVSNVLFIHKYFPNA